MIVGLGGGAPLWPVPPSLWDLNREDRENPDSPGTFQPPLPNTNPIPSTKCLGVERWLRGGEEFPGSRSPPFCESLNPPPHPTPGDCRVS